MVNATTAVHDMTTPPLLPLLAHCAPSVGLLHHDLPLGATRPLKQYGPALKKLRFKNGAALKKLVVKNGAAHKETGLLFLGPNFGPKMNNHFVMLTLA